MNDSRKQRKDPKSTFTITFVIIMALIIQSVLSASSGAGFIGLVAVMMFVGILGFSVAYALSKKKKSWAKKGSMYHMERAKEKAKHMFMREEFDEEAVKCTHPRGREKYIHQLDIFLANGIIDKTEYRVLKERYDKLNIPDNMH